jgi:hypothetical protein
VRGRSLPSANPDNVAAGGATDARCGGEGKGGRRVGVGQITAHSNPPFLFLLVFLSAVCRRGFDEKILLSAVLYIKYKLKFLSYPFNYHKNIKNSQHNGHSMYG